LEPDKIKEKIYSCGIRDLETRETKNEFTDYTSRRCGPEEIDKKREE
jgi:hypothetical protein